MKLTDRIAHAWSAFSTSNEVTERFAAWQMPGPTSYGSAPPQRTRVRSGNDRSIIASLYTRISIDVASSEISHVKVDQNERFVDTVNSFLNDCLKFEANLDQGAAAFLQDVVLTLFEKGAIAIVPVQTTMNPAVTMSYDVQQLRVGEIVEWFPDKVKVSVYNEKTGLRQEVILPKRSVAIVENPLYSVMNEPNGTLQRLIRKLSLLDSIDEQAGSGKLDLIIQLPYVIKSETRRQQAEQRRADIETQLKGSKYGIAYTDGTERITQLNRPAENNMLAQIEKLESSLYSQLGLTEGVFNGSASEAEMLNYHNRTVKPILTAIVQAMTRSFISKTARTQGHRIMFHKDPFSLVTISSIAEVADALIRNKIATSNEIRGIIGMKPSTDPTADQLNNPNMPDATGAAPAGDPAAQQDTTEQDQIMQDVLDQLDAQATQIMSDSGGG